MSAPGRSKTTRWRPSSPCSGNGSRRSWVRGFEERNPAFFSSRGCCIAVADIYLCEKKFGRSVALGHGGVRERLKPPCPLLPGGFRSLFYLVVAAAVQLQESARLAELFFLCQDGVALGSILVSAVGGLNEVLSELHPRFRRQSTLELSVQGTKAQQLRVSVKQISTELDTGASCGPSSFPWHMVCGGLQGIARISGVLFSPPPPHRLCLAQCLGCFFNYRSASCQYKLPLSC